MVEGEVGCASEEEKRKRCHESDATRDLELGRKLGSPNSKQSDLITITKYGTFEPRIQLRTRLPSHSLWLLQPWSDDNDGRNHSEDDATVTMTMTAMQRLCDDRDHGDADNDDAKIDNDGDGATTALAMARARQPQR
jgi:hypothetical protein